MSNCGCGHCDCEEEEKEEVDECDCDHEHNHDLAPEEKIEALKKAIAQLGYGVEETKDGIKITE